jgi:hypothetical protein
MGITLGQQITNIQINLGGAGVTYYTVEEIANSIQDAYNEIAALVLYNVKKVTLNWPAYINFFDFVNYFGVTDYLGTIAIFNNSTDQFLRDDVQLRDFDRLRRDWEWWSGTPQFWAPHSPQYIAITPSYPPNTAGLTFVLYYYAQSPIIVGEPIDPINNDATFLIASDMDDIIEFYTTADLLETAEEPNKAVSWWKHYLDHIVQYKERSHALAKYELLMKI